MNISKALNIVILDQNGTSLPIVSASEMAKLTNAQEIIEYARRRAAEHLQSARVQRKGLRAHFRRRMAQQKRAWQKHYRKRFTQAKEKGTEAALHWLVEQHQWELQIYQRLTREISTLMASRLREISRSFPWEEFLFEQVEPLCEELRSQSSLTLKVAADGFEHLSEKVKQLPLTVMKDTSLQAGYAMLESSLVRIEFTLPEQIEKLCDALVTLSWEQLHESD